MNTLSLSDRLSQFHPAQARQMTDLFVRIREQHMLPDSTTRAIFSDFSSVVQNYHSDLVDITRQYLAAEHNVAIPSDSRMGDVFHKDDFVSLMFSSVSSDYRVSQHIQANMSFVAPVPKFLGQDDKDQDAYMQYVPLRGIFEILLGREDIFAEILSFLNLCQNPDRSENYNDFPDATEFHRRKMGCQPSQTSGQPGWVLNLPILAYEDAFEVCNPIGSAKRKHKLSAVYYTLAFLPPQLRSKRKFHFLSSLCNDKHRKDRGYGKMFESLISELNSFNENPITIGEYKCFPKLFVFCGDNLSSNSLCGLQGSFRTGKICRLCLTSYGDISSKFDPDEFVMRTPKTQSDHIAQFLVDPSSKKDHGVVSECCLTKVTDPTIDITRLFPLDIMHDYLEGVAPLCLTVVMSTLISEKEITLAQINHAIAKFAREAQSAGDLNIYNIEVTKINLKEKRLSGTAAQKWFLMAYLPFILGSSVSGESDGWELLLKSREIAELLLSHSFSKDDIQYLKSVIRQHHTLLRSISPNSFPPKMHYLLHYPYMITLYGPPRRYWTMRFEGVHQYFKEMMRRLKNFRNVPHSLAVRFQYLLASHLSSPNFLTDYDHIEVGKGHTGVLSDLASGVCDLVKSEADIGLFDEWEELFSAEWIRRAGFTYRTGMLVVTFVATETRTPLFMEITHILNIRSSWYLCGNDVVPDFFDRHTWSYVCRKLPSLFCSPLRDLPDSRPSKLFTEPGSNRVHAILPYQIL